MITDRHIHEVIKIFYRAYRSFRSRHSFAKTLHYGLIIDVRALREVIKHDT